ncbi:hypothetical protein [Streptomyces sp. 1222.5]|uniref:hypothetical protein n=1 Tax=Streptomyces sp. 1222.5 TaxID=1881026 RepID=UPI003EBFBE50
MIEDEQARNDLLIKLRAAGDSVRRSEQEKQLAMVKMNQAALDAAVAGVEPGMIGLEYARAAGATLPSPRGGGSEPNEATGRQALAELYTKLPEAERAKSDNALASILGPLAGLTEGTARKYLGAIRSRR